MTYEVLITETLERKVKVEASSLQEAEEKVREAYRREEHVLDWSDFTGVEFKPMESHEGVDGV